MQMLKLLKLLKPDHLKKVPRLLAWEFFSPVGLQGLFSEPRRIRWRTQSRFNKLFPVRGAGFYSRYDWKRLEIALKLCKGPSLLDIGPYNGAFLEMLDRTGRFDRLACVDIVRHDCLTLPKTAEFHLKDVTELDFPAGSFETVTAMEILEHLPVEKVAPALKKIRNVAARRAIMSVPFKEPHPLFKQNEPSGHKQSFDEKKLMELFPTAFFAKVEAGLGVPWLLVIEDKAVQNKSGLFAINSVSEILQAVQSQ